jgi:ubiquinone/menaquinone biosynthesis C-methylase UbiE
MIQFDSDEYWKAKTWDRFKELKAVTSTVRDEFIYQENLTVEKITSLAKRQEFLSILDLGCGTGKITDSILRAIPDKVQITLVDFNEHTLKQAMVYLYNHSNLSFYCMSAYDVGQKFEHMFDVVVCMDFLHHVSNLKLLLNEISRVLKSSGFLIGNVLAAETYRDWDRNKYGTIKSFRRQFLNNISEGLYPKCPNMMKKLIRVSGFARIEPLSKDELVSILSSYFKLLEINSTYYYWFFAKPQKV